MKCITLKVSSQLDYTTVSNTFIDNYMPQANGEFVKIYLYLLRCMSDSSMELSISAIADKFDQTEKDVNRALRYFAGKGLISIEYGADDELSSITFLPMNSELTVVNPAAAEDEANRVNIQPSQPALEVTEGQAYSKVPEKPVYTPAMLASYSEDEEIGQLMYMTQKYLGRPLSTTEAGTIIYLYDSLNFSTELIEYVIEYCISRDHKSMRYIEKVALDWAAAGITTVDEAKDYSGNYSKNVYAVMKAFGLNGRCPAEVERQYIDRWYQEYRFESDIIVEACNRTIQAIHKPNFEYADTILKNWKKNNVTHIKDIEVLDQQFDSKKQNRQPKTPAQTAPNKFNNYSQRTYDFDQLEKMLLTK